MSGWPDPARPGVPLNPERDGEHLIAVTDEHGRVWHEVWRWKAQSKPPVWLRPNFQGPPYAYEARHLEAPCYAFLRYLGPCLTPAEVAAREAAAFQRGAEAQGVVGDIVAERQRQVSEEGWTSAHDDTHASGQMALAAACYAINSAVPGVGRMAAARYWPWSMAWWKPKNQRRDLVRAAALIVAEIERLDRASALPVPEEKA